jgi:hypothetical protein
MRIFIRNALCRPRIGGEIFAERLANALAGRGHAAAVVATHRSGREPGTRSSLAPCGTP